MAPSREEQEVPRTTHQGYVPLGTSPIFNATKSHALDALDIAGDKPKSPASTVSSSRLTSHRSLASHVSSMNRSVSTQATSVFERHVERKPEGRDSTPPGSRMSIRDSRESSPLGFNRDEDPSRKLHGTRRQKKACISVDRFPCVFHAGNPHQHPNDDKAYKYISQLTRHLHTRHEWFVCDKCFTVLPSKDQYIKHRQGRFESHFKSCTSSSCQRWRKASDLRTNASCECIVTREAQWTELFRALYPTSEPPTLTKPDDDGAKAKLECDDYGSSLEVIPSIEDHNDRSSDVTFISSKNFIRSSSDPLFSTSVGLFPLRQLLSDLGWNIETWERRLINLETGGASLEICNTELDERLRELEDRKAEVRRLVGLAWDAFKNQTDPQSGHGARSQQAVAEALPSVFEPLNVACPDENIQSSLEYLAPNECLESRGTGEEGRFAVLSQFERAASCPFLNHHSEHDGSNRQATAFSPDSTADLNGGELGANASQLQSPDSEFNESVAGQHDMRASLLEMIADVHNMLQRTRDRPGADSASAHSSTPCSPRGQSLDCPSSYSRPTPGFPGIQHQYTTRNRARTEPPQSISVSIDGLGNALPTADVSPGSYQESNAAVVTQQDAPRRLKTTIATLQPHRAKKRANPDDYEDDNAPDDPNGKRRCTDAVFNVRLPCLFSAGEPLRYTDSAHLKKYSAISHLRRHLHTNYHSWFVCEKCLTVFSTQTHYLEHYHFDRCIKSCSRKSCRRWRRSSDPRPAQDCDCLISPEDQWRALYCTLYPGSEPPELEHEAGRAMAQLGTPGDGIGDCSQLLASPEETGSRSSNQKFPGMGIMTPSSLAGKPAQSLSELVECLKKQVSELKSRLSLQQQKSDTFDNLEKDLEARIKELEQQLLFLQKHQRTVENMFGLVWAAFESGTAPQSAMGMQLRKFVMETVPSVFSPFGTILWNEQNQAPVGTPALGQHPRDYISNEEGRCAETAQLEAAPTDMPTEFADSQPSIMQDLAIDSGLFDDEFFGNGFGD